MINLETVKALRALRLPGMANELESQLGQPQRYRDLKFEDRLAMLVDAEQINRRINTVKKRMDKSNLTDKQACIEMIEYYEGTDVLKCDVLKVAHHGSKTSSSEAFLDAASPSVAVIQAGRNNFYGHPHAQTLERLEERGIKVCRTDLDGAVGVDIRHGRVYVDLFHPEEHS